MTSKNVRATLVSLTVNGNTTMSVVQNKETAQKLLYVTAMHHWNQVMGDRELPANRKAIVDAFFAPGTGNTVDFDNCLSMSSDYLTVQQKNSDRTLERINKAKAHKKAKAKEDAAKAQA